MKKLLLSSALIASNIFSLSTTHAESFSGFFLMGKGAAIIYNKASLPDLSQTNFGDGELKEYGGFGINGVSATASLGYSLRFANNFVLGASFGGGYKHASIKEARDTAAEKQLGVDFVTSTGTLEGRARLGMAFGRFHVFLDPGLEIELSNPEVTVHYNNSTKDESKKIKLATDKGPEWKERVSFVMGLNSEYAITQTVFIGGRIGVTYSFGDVKNQKEAFDTETMKDVSRITNLAYKSQLGLEIGVYGGATF
jgi:hypothetical protein